MSPVLVRFNGEGSFGAATPVGAPTSTPAAHYRTAAHQAVSENGTSLGLWECTPGRFRRQVASAEFSYFIEGEGSFTPDGGSTIEFRAGDSIYFEPNTQGEWDIRETVIKSYLILP